MLLLIAYDVSTGDEAGVRRLRRVARCCTDYGQRVQKSVFECQVGPVEWTELRSRLLHEIDPSQDSLRIYYLDADVNVEHVGVGVPVDLTGPLVV